MIRLSRYRVPLRRDWKDDVGQQPNIELEIADLPRPQRKPDVPQTWTPDRPGELGGPEDMMWGSGFGAAGPDSGYALSLVGRRDLEMAAGEHRQNANAAVAAVASARSSLYGRAPTGKDIDLALVLLGYDTKGIPTDITEELAQGRLEWFAAVGHHPGKLVDFVGSIEADVLLLTADQARGRLAGGERLIAR